MTQRKRTTAARAPVPFDPRRRGPEKPAIARAAPATEFRISGAYIALDNLLKITGNAPSGGAAKAMVAEGAIKVDGVVELRKTCKIRAGQLVAVGMARIRVLEV